MFVIDTLEFSRGLEKAGMQKKIAETLAEQIKGAQIKASDDVATKNDIRTAIELLRQEIKSAMLTTIISVGTIVALVEKLFN